MVGNGQLRSKDWCFTLNNWTQAEEDEIFSMVAGRLAHFVIIGKEGREEGQTPHLQGFFQLVKRTRLAGVKALPGLSRAHLEPRRGTVQEAADYCKKEGVWTEQGAPTGQGKRSDLVSVKESIDTGASLEDLWEEHFPAMVRYEKSFKRYKSLRARRDPNRAPEVFVLWGSTGTGKSRFSRLVNPELFSVPDVTLKWWDGYEDQECILFDDFDGKECTVANFLRFTDRYDVQVPIKGGFSPLLATRIWITSNTNPDDWFPNELQVKRDAVRRRLTRVVHLENPIRFEHQDDVDHVKILLNLN